MKSQQAVLASAFDLRFEPRLLASSGNHHNQDVRRTLPFAQHLPNTDHQTQGEMYERFKHTKRG